MSVEAALHQLAESIRDFREESKDRSDQLMENIQSLHLTVYGDGNGNPGLLLRMDRQEHKHDTLRKDFDETVTTKKTHIFAIWTAILGAWLSGWFGKP